MCLNALPEYVSVPTCVRVSVWGVQVFEHMYECARVSVSECVCLQPSHCQGPYGAMAVVF